MSISAGTVVFSEIYICNTVAPSPAGTLTDATSPIEGFPGKFEIRVSMTSEQRSQIVFFKNADQCLTRIQ
uniref:AlNc14C404G11408 protein n=1 Tax=Albugo laibachii Nc14 TaxID=890382 RepID=F0WYZ8_9STRA|nr:AlNc14C404G11408 [Albugo laibachii Nc14]CCA27883.1 AlNc14C792G12517 [Albugo laibachii Nc14]|eukprot:CCA27883.1 AlNc14C792G12517 [Albugo laibachii Nc14]